MLCYYKIRYVKKVSAFLLYWCDFIYVKEIISILQSVLQPVDLRATEIKWNKNELSFHPHFIYEEFLSQETCITFWKQVIKIHIQNF